MVLDRQRACRVDIRLLRRIGRALLQDLLHLEQFDLAVYLVAAPRMTAVNETYLQHAGSTDVITFDYADPTPGAPLHGELFVCVDEARIQAARYGTSWQSELTRYLVHGVLHLSGYDDLTVPQRRRMKREEDRLLKALALQFNLAKLAGPSARQPRTTPIRAKAP